MGVSGYSVDFKKSAVEKLLHRGSRSTSTIAEECGISKSIMYKWASDFASVGAMKKTLKSPQDRSADEKLKSVIEFENLPEESRGEFLRKRGLHLEQIKSWREQLARALEPVRLTKAERSERSVDRRLIKDLQRELHRKDRALAETTALLVLKKKADLIWGTGEDT